MEKNNDLRGQAKILDICKRLGVATYINAIGGQRLYSKEDFKNERIELLFINSKNIPKRSIIDVLMSYSIKEIKNMLCSYELV